MLYFFTLLSQTLRFPPMVTKKKKAGTLFSHKCMSMNGLLRFADPHCWDRPQLREYGHTRYNMEYEIIHFEWKIKSWWTLGIDCPSFENQSIEWPHTNEHSVANATTFRDLTTSMSPCVTCPLVGPLLSNNDLSSLDLPLVRTGCDHQLNHTHWRGVGGGVTEAFITALKVFSNFPFNVNNWSPVPVRVSTHTGSHCVRPRCQ